MTKNKVLRVTNYGEEAGFSENVTFQVMSISYVRADNRLVKRFDALLHKVIVKLIDEPAMELCIDGMDLEKLEDAVGTYDIEDI